MIHLITKYKNIILKLKFDEYCLIIIFKFQTKMVICIQCALLFTDIIQRVRFLYSQAWVINNEWNGYSYKKAWE